MTDEIDVMLLERFAAQHDPVPACDFSDVRSRGQTARCEPRVLSMRRWWGRRPVVVAAAVFAAVLLSAAAYAVVRLVIVGSPAPPPVLASEQVLEQVENSLFALSRSGGRQVEVAKTRAEAILNTSSGPVYLWVAPTNTGSRCMYFQITGLDVRFAAGSPFLMALGCISPKQPEALVFRVNTGVDGHTLPLVAGYVPPPGETLQLRFAGGTTSREYPTTDGFVIALGSRYDPDPAAIVRTAHGKVVVPNPVPFIMERFVSASPTGVNRFTITVPLPGHEGKLVLKVGPAARGGSCSQLQVSGWEASGGFVVRGCGPNTPTADQIEINRGLQARPFHRPLEYVQYLKGQVGSEIATLELVFKDGSRQSLPIHHHWVLYSINPANPPTEIIARNTAGSTVATQRVNTNVCFSLSCMKRVEVITAPGHK